MPSPSLALVFATIERPHVVQRLVRSVRKHFPRLPIYVADQSRNIDAMARFYAVNDVKLVRMPYDAGVAASRNRLAREVKEDYFVLCDDDFILGARTKFDDAIQILETHPEIGVVGGRLRDFDGNEEWTRNWELYLEYDPKQKILLSIPIYELAPRVREVAGIRFYLCDAVLNFSVFRTLMFPAGVGWDERFKSNGEHEDFFLNLKVNSPFRVAYLPTMLAYHHHPENYSAYRRRLRDRNDGWARFLEKWGLEQHLELGLGVRTIDDVSTVTDSADARWRFFVNADLSLRRDQAQPDLILIEDFEKIATVGTLDEWGNRTDGEAGIGRLLFNAASRRIIAPPEGTLGPSAPTPDAPADDEDPTERYWLEASGKGRAVSVANEELHFRYDAMLRPDADFFLWYCCKGSAARGNGAANRLAVVVRWSASDGSTLLWHSRRWYLDLQPGDHWRPLLLEVPLRPRDCRWLRFDVVTDGGANSHPVCTGFLFGVQNGDAGPGQAMHNAGFEVVALSRIAHDGASPGANGAYLDDVGRRCARKPVTVHASDLAPDMSLLRIDEVADLEVLFFVGWDTLGRSLVSARLPAAALQAPAALAVPGVDWRAPGGRVFGFGAKAGFVQLSVAEEATPVRR